MSIGSYAPDVMHVYGQGDPPTWLASCSIFVSEFVSEKEDDMPGAPVKSVVITPDNEARFRKRFDKLQDRIRKRAFELYCRRARLGSEKADRLQAEREIILSPLACIEDNDNEIRIIAAVPDVDPGHLTVDVLPCSIVVEGEAATSPVERYSVFPLRGPIKPAAVRAEFSNGDLTIVAPKADTAD